MLNNKQEKFCQAYVLHRNATEAAKAAGYSAGSANKDTDFFKVMRFRKELHNLNRNWKQMLMLSVR
jgi:phage terminase small subunit